MRVCQPPPVAGQQRVKADPTPPHPAVPDFVQVIVHMMHDHYGFVNLHNYRVRYCTRITYTCSLQTTEHDRGTNRDHKHAALCAYSHQPVKRTTLRPCKPARRQSM